MNGIARSNKDLDPQMILGHLSFYTIGDLRISETELEQIFDNNGLPRHFIKKISKIDAFRRATSAAKSTIEVDYNGQKVKAKLEVDEVRCDQSGIVRLLGRKIVDDNQAEVSYETVGRIDFVRGANVVTTGANAVYATEYDYENVLKDVQSRFQDWSVYHTKDTVRNLAVSIIKSLYPVNLMPSGVAKFIPKTQQGNLYALQGVVRDLARFGTGNAFEIIPVIDTDEQRDLVDRMAKDDIKGEMNQFVEELKGVITLKQTIPQSTAKTYVLKFRELQTKVQEYEGLMGTYMQVLRTQIQKSLEFVDNNIEP